MPEAYIVDAVRTPVGRRGGGFAAVHPADLGAHVIRTLVDRTDIDPAAIDDVIFGCLDQIGSQAGDIARTAALAAGLPETVPGVTIDRQCGSAQQAVHFAAQGVMSGTADLIIAGGVQKMSQYPILSAFGAGEPFGATDPWTGSNGWHERYGDQEISQFVAAERIAEQWGFTREDMEQYALASHQCAAAAQANGHFDREIAAYEGVQADEGPRPDTSLEKMASLKTLVPGGRLTAAVSSQISDASAALLIASEAAVRDHGLTPRARIHHLSVLGDDPVLMLTAPIPATQSAFKKSGLSIGDIDTIEINEAFASVVLAWQADIDADPARVNPNGGAIALGHPIGATGARLMTSLLHELERTGGRYGLQTMCEGGGQANVTIIERLG
jgi:acetyl-CoA C-acetyltransferase